MKALRAQIDEMKRNLSIEQNRMLLQAKESYLAAKAAEDKTEQELEAKKTEANNQGDDRVQFTLVQREFEQNRSLYDGLQLRLRTAELQAGLDAAEVDVIDKAQVPVNPTLQPPTTIIITTTVFFLLGGIVIAFLLESLDTGLHNIAEIEAVMELPSLAIIPRSKRMSGDPTDAMSTAQRNVNVLTQPKSQFTESFRSLRTSLLLSTTGHPPKYILFTSATPSEGKTTTASNLACVLAQRDTSVLLIDADLRRPNVHHRFGLTGKVGLTSVLSGTIPFEEAVQHIAEVPNLDILPSGPVPPFPTEMLSSEAMRALLERLGGMYTHVVIDSPPILSVTDGVILARMVDAVVLVIRHGKSTKHIIRRARDLMVRSGAPMAGVVLNAVDLNSPEYYGYYGYSGYSYGAVDSDSWETQGRTTEKTGRKGGRSDDDNQNFRESDERRVACDCIVRFVGYQPSSCSDCCAGFRGDARGDVRDQSGADCDAVNIKFDFEFEFTDSEPNDAIPGRGFRTRAWRPDRDTHVRGARIQRYRPDRRGWDCATSVYREHFSSGTERAHGSSPH